MCCSPKTAVAMASARPVDGFVSAAVTAEKVDRWYLPALSELTGIPMTRLGSMDYLQQRGRSRHASMLSRPHSWNGDLPARSLLHLGNDIYLCSPEFVFLQLSGFYDVIELSNIAMAMSGGYMPAHVENDLVEHGPTTSVARLRSFAMDASMHWGVDKSVQATRWALDNSRSPMETSLALLIYMPRALGGYGLVRPVLNRRIYLSEESTAIYPHRYCEADVSAPGSSLLLEYLGRAFHKEEHHDIQRELALQREGYQLQYVTIHQLVDGAQRKRDHAALRPKRRRRPQATDRSHREKKNRPAQGSYPRSRAGSRRRQCHMAATELGNPRRMVLSRLEHGCQSQI